MWAFLLDTLLLFTFPLVHIYHILTSDLLFNTADVNATGIESLADTLLVPYQYVLAGKRATLQPDGTWDLAPRFPVRDAYWPKMAASVIALPFSAPVGILLKSFSFLHPGVLARHLAMRPALHLNPPPFVAYDDLPFAPQNLPRRPGDEHNLAEHKECLVAVTKLLNAAHIPWWLDCGSCLGAYRYGGVIPWDEDIDIAVLLPDFDNILAALRELDPTRYIVEDWSSRDYPKSYIKIFPRNASTCLDIYHFALNPDQTHLVYLLSMESNVFLPEWWKIRERRFTVPTPIEEIFPLKTATFDGISVYLPQNPERYLQRRYGENLAPAKIYDPVTKNYEKDPTHPYWQRVYAH